MRSKGSKPIAYWILALRIMTLLSLIAVVVLLLINNYKLSDGYKQSFKRVGSYRYLLSTAVIGAAYTLVQLPFSLYYASTGKRLIPKAFFPQFEFLGDKIVSLLLATGVGVGFGVSVEAKKVQKQIFGLLFAIVNFNKETSKILDVNYLNELNSKNKDFLDKMIIASGVLLLGCLCMALTSLLSSINRKTK